MKYFSMEEAAEFLGIHKTTMKDWIVKRTGRGFREFTTKIGGKRIITEVNMDRYLNGLVPVNQEIWKESK